MANKDTKDIAPKCSTDNRNPYKNVTFVYLKNMSRSFSNTELTAIATLLIASIFSLIVIVALIIEKKGNKQLRNLLLIILFGNF